MEDSILYKIRDRIAVITMNRPDRLNAYTQAMGREMKRAMATANNDSDVRVIVLTGSGRGFCAGADMDALSSYAATGAGGGVAAQDSDLETQFRSVLGPDLSFDFRDAERFSYFVRTKKPVIAALNGPAAGMGFVMALYADMRFAAENAVFTTSFAQRGLIAEHGVSWLLPRLIGQANALDLLLSARRITASEAKAIGLVNEVYPRERFLDEVFAYARHLAERVSPRSMAIMKAQVWKANFQNFNEAIESADEEMKTSLTTSEFREGVAHFLEKRAPNFADI